MIFGGKFKERGSDYINKLQEEVNELSKFEYKCPHCEAVFEDDDFAYLLETGQCQYCHENIELE